MYRARNKRVILYGGVPVFQTGVLNRHSEFDPRRPLHNIMIIEYMLEDKSSVSPYTWWCFTLGNEHLWRLHSQPEYELLLSMATLISNNKLRGVVMYFRIEY